MSEVERSKSTELTVRDDQQGWTEKQVAALRQLGVEGAGNADLAVFFHYAKRTQLDPFARQIYMISRNSFNPKTEKWETKWTIQTGIDGFRVIARRAADRSGIDYGYEPEQWCGQDGVWRDVWVGKNSPHAAKITVIRNGKPFTAVALFSEYAATRKVKGKNGQPDTIELTGQWPTKPAVMIAKCAEALALRKAFPQDLSGLYSEEEMEQADNPVDLKPGDVVQATVEPDPNPEPTEEYFKQLIKGASTRDECLGIWEEAKKANAPGKIETLIVQRMQEIKAGHIVAETVEDAPAGDVVEAEVVEDKPAPKGRSRSRAA
jgi:phage recombination protein Bet